MAYLGFDLANGIGSLDSTTLTGHTVILAAYDDDAGNFQLWISNVPSDLPGVFETLKLYNVEDGVMVSELASYDVADATYNNVGSITIDSVVYESVGVYVWTDTNPFYETISFGLRFVQFVEEQTSVPYQGTVWWPHLDLGSLGSQKMLDSIDVVSDAPEGLSVSVGYDQRNLTYRTPAYEIDADTLPGQSIPIPVSGPSFDLKLVFAPGQVWELQAANLYIQDGRKN